MHQLLTFNMAGWSFHSVKNPYFGKFMGNVRPNFVLPSANLDLFRSAQRSFVAELLSKTTTAMTSIKWRQYMELKDRIAALLE
ncbi:hypothetical protein WJX77_001528 [Trebouxia sp. C0004]